MVAKPDKPLKEKLKDFMEKHKLSMLQVARLTGIKSGRMYKWYQENTNPKDEDANVLRNWMTRYEGGEVSTNEPSRDEHGPSYRTQLWYGKVMGEDFFVPFVPVKAQAGYSKNYENMDFVNELETYQMPPGMKHRGAEWRWFEVEGESMEPTFYGGDIILCSLVPHEDWQNLEEWLIYVLVTQKAIWVKRVAKLGRDQFVLASEDEDRHPQFAVNIEDVREVWKVRRQLNAKFPPRKRYKINL
jgi:phage repressor protein C with HTH and peptisase S24 domain